MRHLICHIKWTSITIMTLQSPWGRLWNGLSSCNKKMLNINRYLINISLESTESSWTAKPGNIHIMKKNQSSESRNRAVKILRHIENHSLLQDSYNLNIISFSNQFQFLLAMINTYYKFNRNLYQYHKIHFCTEIVGQPESDLIYFLSREISHSGEKIIIGILDTKFCLPVRRSNTKSRIATEIIQECIFIYCFNKNNHLLFIKTSFQLRLRPWNFFIIADLVGIHSHIFETEIK